MSADATRMRRSRAKDDSSFRFGMRLFLALALALSIVGTAGYFVIDHEFRGRVLDSYAREQAAQVASLRRIAENSPGLDATVREIEQRFAPLAVQPGTLELL